MLITIEQAYTQCSKASIRSDVWNPEKHIERSALPSSGAILRSLTSPDFDADEYDRERAERYARREGMYLIDRYFVQPVGVDVVDEPAHDVAVWDEFGATHAQDRLAHVCVGVHE